ncbi:15168_t:CDS:1 [Racocetra persica]|uniref:15168_t:CDS:1 n=1 Tax=Racocetra persica TaxID=160502 RepID=A0ACA9M1V7_9GLOM|nr:15168_t:CDS:1 [Racocetra persica]
MRIWVKQVTNSEMFLTKLMIKEQVADFAKALNLGEDALKFLHRWVHKFKQHNNLRNIRLHREANSVPLSLLSEYREKLRELIKNYMLDNVFNADEIGLFFHIASDQTLASRSRPGFKKVSNYISLF